MNSSFGTLGGRLLYRDPSSDNNGLVPYTFPRQVPSAPEEIEFQRLYGPWAVVTPTDVASILGAFDAPWWIAGGWALDAYTGTRREHGDLDAVVFGRDLPKLRQATAGRLHLWSAAAGALRPVNDEFTDVQDGSCQVWVRENATAAWLLDILLNPSRDGAWVHRRTPAIAVPLDTVTWLAPDGVRYLNPEIVLTFKAKHARPKDHSDLERTWPHLDEHQRATVRNYLHDHHPDHEWLPELR